MKNLTPLLLILLASCSTNQDETAFEGPGLLVEDAPLLSCRLESSRAVWKSGETVDLQVRLVNESAHALTLIGALDASDNAWRYPHCVWERQDAEGRWRAIGSGPRGGNTNDLRKEDLFEVGAGGSFDPYQHVDHGGFFRARVHRAEYFAEPGEYRLRFRYSTESDDIADFRGDLNQGFDLDRGLRKPLSRVPRVTLVSNELVLTVEP